MSAQDTGKQDATRILVVYPDPAVRQSVEQALRRVNTGPLVVYEANGPAEALEKARLFDPRVVLLGLDESEDLALDVARALRGARRAIVGLYNPVTAPGTKADGVRRAARAGISDFVALPPADAELAAALAAAAAPAEADRWNAEGQTFGFYSNKGGAGTSTLAANVAVALARQSAGTPDEVALFDADLQAGCSAQLLGLHPDRDTADLAADLDRGGPLRTYLLRHAESGLFVLASPRDLVRAEAISPEDASRIAIALRQQFRTVVIDLSSRMDALTLSLLDLSETVCVLTEPILPTLQRTACLLSLLEEQGFEPSRLKVALRRLDVPESELTDEAIHARLGRTVDWVVPYERRACEAINRGTPLALERPRSDFSEAVTTIARSLAGSRPARTGP